MQVLLQVENGIETTYSNSKNQYINQHNERIFDNIILLGSLDDESVLIFNFLYLGYK